MTDIDRLLDAYPTLAPAERADVDARLAALGAEAAPYAEAHAEARRLAAFADALGAATGSPDLGRLAAADHLGLPGASERLAATRAADPDLDAQADALAARLQALDAAAEPPAARFERLTGRRLGARPPAPGGDAAPSEPLALFAAPDAPPARPRRRLRLVWMARAAAVALVAYGGLFAASALTVSERAQVASLDEVEAVGLPVVRGAQTPAARLEPALAAVGAARHSTLGLFPRYDAAALASAADGLAAVAADADPASAASQEARLALGRVYLHLGRDAEAARVLGALVAEGRYQAPTARRLLDFVRTQGEEGAR